MPLPPPRWKWVPLLAFSGYCIGCQLDQLIQPPGASELTVSPTALADSASLGSRSMRHRNITIAGAPQGGASWRAVVAGRSTWLTLERSEDTVPSKVGVSLNPAGLALGTYQDTIAITSDLTDSTTRIPVSLVVLVPPRLVIATQPTSGAAGRPIQPPVVVLVQDAAGHTVSDFGGSVTLALGANPGNASLVGTATVNASEGVATFPDLALNRKGNGFTLVASADGMSQVESVPFNQTLPPISPSRSTVTVSPNVIGASTGSSSATITVTAIDELGDPVSGAPIVILVPGAGNVLVPPTGLTSAAGVMTASLSSTTSGARTVTATAGGVTLGTAAPLTVLPGPAVQIAFTVQPGDLVLGSVFSPPIQASPLDAFGNVADFHGAISLTLGGGPQDARLLGTITVPVAGGAATFPGVSVSRDGVGYVLWARSDGVAPALSRVFNVIRP